VNAARIVRGAALRLALAFGVAAFTAALSLAALVSRTEQLAAAPTTPLPISVAAEGTPAATTTAANERGSAGTALRTDI